MTPNIPDKNTEVPDTDPFPRQGDTLEIPEWVDDMEESMVRLHIHQPRGDSTEYEYTIMYYAIRDESEDEAVIQSDTTVSLDKRR